MKKLLVILALCLAGCGTAYRDTSVKLNSMAVFDAARYAGLWYEVASFPTTFQKGCLNTQADYDVIADGILSVRNSCFRNGGLSVIEGRATVVGPGRLKVRLGLLPFGGDYWVLWVDQDYQTAVVGTPSGRAGWILNRTPAISEDRLKAARDILEFNGYDLTLLNMTVQEGAR